MQMCDGVDACARCVHRIWECVCVGGCVNVHRVCKCSCTVCVCEYLCSGVCPWPCTGASTPVRDVFECPGLRVSAHTGSACPGLSPELFPGPCTPAWSVCECSGLCVSAHTQAVHTHSQCTHTVSGVFGAVPGAVPRAVHTSPGCVACPLGQGPCGCASTQPCVCVCPPGRGSARSPCKASTHPHNPGCQGGCGAQMQPRPLSRELLLRGQLRELCGAARGWGLLLNRATSLASLIAPLWCLAGAGRAEARGACGEPGNGGPVAAPLSRAPHRPCHGRGLILPPGGAPGSDLPLAWAGQEGSAVGQPGRAGRAGRGALCGARSTAIGAVRSRRCPLSSRSRSPRCLTGCPRAHPVSPAGTGGQPNPSAVGAELLPAQGSDSQGWGPGPAPCPSPSPFPGSGRGPCGHGCGTALQSCSGSAACLGFFFFFFSFCNFLPSSLQVAAAAGEEPRAGGAGGKGARPPQPPPHPRTPLGCPCRGLAAVLQVSSLFCLVWTCSPPTPTAPVPPCQDRRLGT